MKKEDKILVVVVSCIIVATFAVTILLALYTASTWTKTYRLNNQYIGSLSQEQTYGLAPCNNCLIMEVQDEWYVPSGLITNNYTFFFANEHELRSDLQPGDEIKVRWRIIDGKRLIRGAWKQ